MLSSTTGDWFIQTSSEDDGTITVEIQTEANLAGAAYETPVSQEELEALVHRGAVRELLDYERRNSDS